jgi:hypothetical protein
MDEGKARQGKARQGKARQGKGSIVSGNVFYASRSSKCACRTDGKDR